MSKGKGQKQNDTSLPHLQLDHDQTRDALEGMTDRFKFQKLCDALLEVHKGYDMHPRGGNARGTVKGQPDSWAYDPQGNLCACMYGTSSRWRKKLLKTDIPAVKRIVTPDFTPTVFIFCTNRHIDASVERELVSYVKAHYGWELRLFGQNELADWLDNSCQDIRQRYLDIRIESHNWRSLLSACDIQRKTVISRYEYEHTYFSTLYVPRHAELIVESWYRQAIDNIDQGSASAQLLPIIDQTGAGKTTLVIRVAEQYSKFGPVLLLPGDLAIRDHHGLEEEIVRAVESTVEGRPYRAELDRLCQIVRHEKRPFLVILDDISKNDDPKLLRSALVYLLTTYQEYPLLLLLTCRDTAWSYLSDPTFRRFTYLGQSQDTDGSGIRIGPYNDEEFSKALEQYFTHWNVSATLGPKASQVLRSPLLLRIFTEVFKDRNLGYVQEIVDTELWQAYWDMKVKDISEGMDRYRDEEVISSCIEQLASKLVRSDSLQLILDDLTDISFLDPYDRLPKSLMSQLQSAGIVQKSQSGIQLSTISFVYETFLEFIISRPVARRFEHPAEREDVLVRLEELALAFRWHQVPLHVAELVSEPGIIIDRLRRVNLWLAALALKRVQQPVPKHIRQQIIDDLENNLGSRYILDRRRAAELLGLLGASESKQALLQCWLKDGLYASLRALARLGGEEAIIPLMRYLGRFLEWYLPEDQELINVLPKQFRELLVAQAIASLGDAENGAAAAHTLGYLRAEAAVIPLLARLEASEFRDWVALMALLQIGTQEAFSALEHAVGEIGERISLCDLQETEARRSGNHLSAAKTRNDLYGTLMHLRVRGLQHSPLKVILPFLSRLLEHPNFYVRSEAIHSLGILGAAEMAAAIVQSANLDENEAITKALELFGPQIHIEPFLALVRDDMTPNGVMRYAIQALGFSHDPRALEPLEALVKQRRFLFDTIQALGHLGRPEAVPILGIILAEEVIDYDRANISYELAVTSLGRLYHPAAFVPLEQFARKLWPNVWLPAIEALVATGRERALPLLSELWPISVAPEARRTILRALLWLNTEKAITTLLELLAPIDEEKITLLISELMLGSNLPWIGESITYGSADDRLVDFIEAHFDHLAPRNQQNALFALATIQTSSAQRLLESIASDEKYDIPLPSDARKYGHHTIRTEALRVLISLGSGIVIESVLDEILEKAATGLRALPQIR